MADAPTPSPSRLVQDVKFVVKHAAIIGFLLAALCHLLPPSARVVCDSVKDLCGLSKD